jgi:hypothetical protein
VSFKEIENDLKDADDVLEELKKLHFKSGNLNNSKNVTTLSNLKNHTHNYKHTTPPTLKPKKSPMGMIDIGKGLKDTMEPFENALSKIMNFSDIGNKYVLNFNKEAENTESNDNSENVSGKEEIQNEPESQLEPQTESKPEPKTESKPEPQTEPFQDPKIEKPTPTPHKEITLKNIQPPIKVSNRQLNHQDSINKIAALKKKLLQQQLQQRITDSNRVKEQLNNFQPENGNTYNSYKHNFNQGLNRKIYNYSAQRQTQIDPIKSNFNNHYSNGPISLNSPAINGFAELVDLNNVEEDKVVHGSNKNYVSQIKRNNLPNTNNNSYNINTNNSNFKMKSVPIPQTTTHNTPTPYFSPSIDNRIVKLQNGPISNLEIPEFPIFLERETKITLRSEISNIPNNLNNSNKDSFNPTKLLQKITHNDYAIHDIKVKQNNIINRSQNLRIHLNHDSYNDI